jgi:crotonobetaine/carnitine-CoA ligase
MSNLVQAIVRIAEERPALQVGVIGDELPLANVLALAAGRAIELLDSGLTPGDRVALIAPTSTDYLVTWLGCLLAGTPVALVDPTYPDDLLDDMLARLAPQVILDKEDVRRTRIIDRRLPPAGSLPGLTASPLEIVSYMHASGTSGPPKFCAQSGEYFLRLARAMAGALDLQRGDRVLAPLPMHHINPLGYGVVTALLTGADALTVERFSASSFWRDVVSAGVTVCILQAPPVEILKRCTTAADARGHRVRAMFYADAEFQRDFGIPHAVTAYGSTELGGVSHLARWTTASGIPDDAGRHGGLAREDLESRLDPDGSILVRELVRGSMFDGYLTSDGVDPSRDDQGWFDTGDLGTLDGDGYLVFLERRPESNRVKGE